MTPNPCYVRIRVQACSNQQGALDGSQRLTLSCVGNEQGAIADLASPMDVGVGL